MHWSIGRYTFAWGVALFPSKSAGDISYLKGHSHVNHIAVVKKHAHKKEDNLAKDFLPASLMSEHKQQAWTQMTSLC